MAFGCNIRGTSTSNFREHHVRAAWARRLRPSLGFVSALFVLALEARAQERVTFFVNDALGSPVVGLDASGAVIWRGDYDPFGSLIAQSGTINPDRQWMGAQFDVESGLLALGRRFYHSGLGRFLSPDPALIGGLPPAAVVMPARLNMYSYGLNNPLRYSDPTGAFAIESHSLRQSKEFTEAVRLLKRTREGSRILWALDFAAVDVRVFDVAFPHNAAFHRHPQLLAGARVRAGRQLRLESAEWDHLVLIDLGIISFARTRRDRLRSLATVLYHELRHAENDVDFWPFDLETNASFHAALDSYRRPSLDYRERAFQRQLEKQLEKLRPARGHPQ